MRFIVYTEDKDNSLHIRQTNREAHIAWLKSESNVKVLTAGPWLDDDGVMRGSMLIVDAESKADVSAWLQHDPYAKAHLPKLVDVKPFVWAIGAPE